MTDETKRPLSHAEVNQLIADKTIRDQFTIISYGLNTTREKRREIRNWCANNVTGRWFSHSNTVQVNQENNYKSGPTWFSSRPAVKITAYYGFDNRVDATLFRLTWGGDIAE